MRRLKFHGIFALATILVLGVIGCADKEELPKKQEQASQASEINLCAGQEFKDYSSSLMALYDEYMRFSKEKSFKDIGLAGKNMEWTKRADALINYKQNEWTAYQQSQFTNCFAEDISAYELKNLATQKALGTNQEFITKRESQFSTWRSAQK